MPVVNIKGLTGVAAPTAVYTAYIRAIRTADPGLGYVTVRCTSCRMLLMEEKSYGWTVSRQTRG